MLESTPAAAEEEKAEAKTESCGEPLGLYGTLGAIWSLDAFDVPAEANRQNSYALDTRIGWKSHGQYQWAARYEVTQGGAQVGTISDATDFGLRVGGGLNWFFTDHFGMYGELTYLKAFGSLKDIDAVPIAFGGIARF
jgi:hypothetical protein